MTSVETAKAPAPASAPQPGIPHIEHRVLRSFNDAQALKAEWDKLAAADGDLFCSFEWCEVWWRHYGCGRELELHAIFEDRRLIGILPLVRQRIWLGPLRLVVVRALGADHAANACATVIRAGHVETVMRAVLGGLQRGSRWDVLHLGPFRYAADTAAQLAGAGQRSAQVAVVILGEHDSCATWYELPATMEGYMEVMPSGERRNVRRCERNLRAEHEVEVQLAQLPGEIQESMGLLVSLHQDLWTGKGQLGQFVDWPGFEQFHRDMALTQAAAGRLLLVKLLVDGQPLGVEYGYHFGSRVHALIRGYRDDPPWRTFSLGRMLHCQMVQQAIARGARAMDDGRGVFEYKHRLGGKLCCEQSVTFVRTGRLNRLRFWAALRLAYLVYSLYGRMWFDLLRPRLRLRGKPLRRLYVVSAWLAQLYKRGGLSLFGRQPMTRTPCINCAGWTLCPIMAERLKDAPAPSVRWRWKWTGR